LKKHLLLLLVIFSAQITVIYAQDGGQPLEGTDSFNYQNDSEGRPCYIYNKYIFVARPTESNGYHIYVYKRAKSPAASPKLVSPPGVCQKIRGNPFMIIKDSDEQFFSGASGDKVFIDSGTGTDSRKLAIINLPSKKTIYSVEAREIGKISGSRYLTYTEFSDHKRPLSECPQAKRWRRESFSIGWVQKVRLDLENLKKINLGKISCTALQ